MLCNTVLSFYAGDYSSLEDQDLVRPFTSYIQRGKEREREMSADELTTE